MSLRRWSVPLAGLVLMLALGTFGWFNYQRAQASPAQQQQPLVYSVKYVCGRAAEPDPLKATVRPGLYATEINIHNFHTYGLDVRKRVIPLVYEGQPVGREPNFGTVKATDGIGLPPDTATMDDCPRIVRELLGVAGGGLHIGYLELISLQPLAVDAVYTAQGADGGVSIDVQRVRGLPQ